MIRKVVPFALAVLMAPATALAHPHAWIDLRSQVLLDEQGRAYGLELVWLFDDYYTVLVAEELGADGQPGEDYLQEITERNLTNLEEYDYFTDVTYDGVDLATGEVTQYEGEVNAGRLQMRFELPFEEPVDPVAGELTFSVYDPTYYIEIVHLEGEPVLFSGDGSDRCIGAIEPPNPTMEQVSLAAALDKDETAGDGLGELFAETVVVSCS